MNKNIVNIVFISDDNYIMPTCVAITSIIMNKNININYNINILAVEISDINKKNILDFIKSNANDEVNINIIFEINKYIQFEHGNLVATSAALFKFNIADIFSNLDKVLYLDSDIIVLKDLSVLFNTDIEDYYAAAIKDFIQIKMRNNKLAEKVNGYFNSGILLLNTRRLRKEKIADKLIEYKKNIPTGFMDQDAFNYVFNGKIKYLSPKYNFFVVYEEINKESLLNFFEEDSTLFNNINIIHYAKFKPWKENKEIYYNKYYDYFWKYYQYTNWFKNSPMDSFLTIVKQNNGELNLNLNNEIIKINNRINEIDNKINDIYNELVKNRNKKLEFSKNNCFDNIKLFGINNNKDYIFVYLFGIKFTFKINENRINKISWWIPVKKWREHFRNKFRPDQTRPDQTRPDSNM